LFLWLLQFCGTENRFKVPYNITLLNFTFTNKNKLLNNKIALLQK
jgi:hypothetical protein